MGWLRVYPDSPDWGNIPVPEDKPEDKKDDDGDQEDEKDG